MKHALICGISGQDGAFLADCLLKKNYRVVGTTRRMPGARFEKLEQLGIRDQITLVTLGLDNPGTIRDVLAEYAPDEIYHLAGQSSVGRSFEFPKETFESIAGSTLNLLEAVRDSGLPARIFIAGSGDMFGSRDGCPADESSALAPVSPYGEAKAAAFGYTETFRESGALFACTGILFSHESFLRPPGFVTGKIVRTACEIARGKRRELVLGNMDIQRDWGWAPEYVDAMWQMLQHDEPLNFIIATGTTIRLADFVQTVFSCLDLDWKTHVRTDASLFRPADISIMAADPSKARDTLGWQARFNGYDVAQMMVAAELDEATFLKTFLNRNGR
jgi:GDPmannose 4,6-dehydratase